MGDGRLNLFIFLKINVFLFRISRKLDPKGFEEHQPFLTLAQKIISQKRGDSNKIYSLHSLSRKCGKPDVKCYAKGKDHKKFEFGSKTSIMVDQSTGIIVGTINFTESLHDSKTIPQALD